MKNYIQPYIKEKNLLQLSLFYFGKGRPKKTVVEWSDSERDCKLQCVCDCGVPGSFEQDVYTVATRIWVRQGMKDRISFNYSDIARELHLDPKSWVGRIKQGMKRLAEARYKFTECFILATEDGKERVTTIFSLFDSASLFEYKEGKSKRNSESIIIFPDIVRENLEAKYYQLLEMVWYRALPEGLPRRLYEYLEKRRHHHVNGSFSISEEAICRWLPIVDKHTTNRRKRLKTVANELVKSGYLIDYEFDKKKKLCIYTYSNDAADKVKGFLHTDHKSEDQQEKILPKPVGETISGKVKATYLEALKWLSTIPYFHEKRKDDIAAMPIGEVAELYPWIRKRYEKMSAGANKPGPGWVYSAFQKKYQFTEQIKEEEKEQARQKLEGELREKAEQEARKQAEKEQLDAQRAKFKEELQAISQEVLEEIWQKAQKAIPPDMLGRGLNVKIQYVTFLKQYFRDMGREFPDAISSDLAFVKEISLK